jgi:hypothetical protein
MASKKTSIGIFIDGQEIKLARLSVHRGTVVLNELESQHLDAKLEEQRQNTETVTLSVGGDSTESFALATPPPDVATPESTGDNNSVVLGLLSRYQPGKYTLSYAITEPSIYYHTFENDFGLKGKKLRKRVLEELGAIRSANVSPDSVDYFQSVDKNLVAVIREDGMSLLRILESIKEYIGKRLPRIPLVDSADIALMNLARSNFGFGPEEFTSIVYVGVEFTRIIFMKGSEFFHFAPVLGEGFDSPNIRNTVYSRLLLEQDNVGIPRVDKILLAGEARQIQFDEFLREQLPEVEVQYLTTPYLDSSALPTAVQEKIPEFAIAIATAWKALDEEHPGFYPVNLLPDMVRESQRAFKLAWHGYALLLAIFFLTFLFTSRFGLLQNELGKRRSTVGQLRTKVAENQRLQVAINNLNDDINKYNLALAVYDSMAPGSDKWSKILEHLSKGAEDLNSLWITELHSSADGGMTLKGYALQKSRIPRIAALFDNATLTKVEVKTIREKTPIVYSFEITVPPIQTLLKDTSAAQGAARAAQ